MVAQPWRFGALNQLLQSAQMFAIEGLSRPEVNRNPVLYDAVSFQNLIEHGKRPAAIHHEILGDNLEPVHHRFVLEDVLVMRNAQANAYAVIGKSIEATSGHG